MKNWIICIAILVSNSSVFACGPWYPYGEDIRFSLFTPSLFVDESYSEFNYTAWLYNERKELNAMEDPNSFLWKSYCNHVPSIEDVYNAIYVLKANELSDKNSSNTFVQYLNSNNDIAAINYLKFAKSCSEFSQVTYDPWERKGDHLKRQRNKKIKAALKKCSTESNELLKRRYAFLALRLAYYSGNESQVNSIYNTYFNVEKRDVIDYWAGYFKLCFEPSSAERNVELAQIFENCPDKRFATTQLFDRKIDITTTINAAKSNREKGNLIVMYAMRNSGRCADLIQLLEETDPTNPQLSFLIVREINKIEDWVLTPKYNLFPPSLEGDFYYSDEQENQYDQRIESDQEYAKQFAGWLDGLSIHDKDLQLMTSISSAYLSHVSGDAVTALSKFRNVGKIEKPKIQYLFNQLNLLAQVDAHATEKWITQSNIDLLSNSDVENYSNFVFAIGREAEYNKQTSLAACFYSHLNKNTEYWEESEAWRAPNNVTNLYGDYFLDYFFYLDAQYSIEEVQNLISRIEKNDFPNEWLTKYISSDIERLYDLLGTKQLRENELDKAISAFAKVSDSTWHNREYWYDQMLDANPFYTNFYAEHEKTDFDTVRYTKFEIAKRLNNYLDKANDVNNGNRSKNYFIAANCYLNMTHYGNSWMMRRYWWSTNQVTSGMVDDDEFAGCLLARKYYKKAYDLAKNDKQKALCLRMIGRCEKYARMYENEYDWNMDYEKFGGYEAYIFSKNKTYQELKSKYPDDYDVMMSNCESFSDYYAAF